MENKLSIYQCGFRKGMSAQNCLLLMIEKWRKSLDNKGKAGVLLTDLSKAFDCLVHDLLIAKLGAYYGFDYLSLKLIHSYLSDRFQRVRINASFSSWRDIICGVPQGSILGPDLFNIYTGDLFLFLLLEIANYADDNSPFSCAKSIPTVISQLENDSAILLNWMRNNGLKANPNKFHLILSENDDLAVNVDRFKIQNNKCKKLLGIKIDNKMAFNDHVSDICTKASQKLHALSRISWYMTVKLRKTTMQSFILSQFGYCPLVWMFHSRKLNNRINGLHERALRLVYEDNESTFRELLNRDESFTIHERNIQTLAIELYKVANGLSPEIMNFVFPLNVKKYPGQNDFATRNVKNVGSGTETLSHLGPQIWTIIPASIKKSKSLYKFRKEIRNWKPDKCPCRLCKSYIKDLGFVTVKQ